MKLEQQIPSLELCKKLKEMGVKQESLFYWQGYLYSEEKIELVCKEKLDKEYDFVSATTVAELGEMLPENVCWRGYQKVGGKWGFEFGDFRAEDETEANARAKMLIYLLENKLISS